MSHWISLCILVYSRACLRQFIRKPGLKNSKDEVSMLGGLGVPSLVFRPVLGQ